MHSTNNTLVEIRPGKELHIINSKNSSNKTIFLLHGLGGRAEQFAAQINFFRNDYNIVAPDLLGHGSSTKPQENATSIYSFKELSKDIQAIFDSYRTEENFIIGHSYGGAFATYLTLNNADKIKKFVLITPASLHPKIAPIKIFHLPIFLLEMLRPLFTNIFVKMVFDPKTDPQLITREVAIARTNPMYVIKPCTLGMLKIPNVDISKIAQPTLIILGEKDRLIPAQQIHEFYRQLPHVEFKEIKNASHMVMMEQPEQVNRLIKIFFDSDNIT